MPHLKLFLLGPPHLEIDGRAQSIPLRKAMALLVYLAVTRRPHTRDELAAFFWPESDQVTSRADLRRTLYKLKGIIGEGFLQTAGDQIAVAAGDHTWSDVQAFEEKVRGCRFEAESDDCYALLAEAAECYAGDFMAGFTLPDCPQFDEWQFFQQESLRQELTQVLDALSAAAARTGRLQEALHATRRRVALDGLNEPAQRRLMELYFQTGQKAAALRQYRECTRVLQAELGGEPQPETRTLFEHIQTSRPPEHPPHRSTAPRTGYVQSGEVYLAQQVIGRGGPDIVLVPGFVSHLEHIWKEPQLAGFLEKLASLGRLILFDKRGVGLSDRLGYAPGLEQTCQDIAAVMAAAGSRQAILLGVSEGGPASILFAGSHPERVLGVVLYGTLAKGTRSPDYPFALRADQYDRWLQHMLHSWGSPVGIEFFAPSRSNDPALRSWWAELLRLAASPGSMRLVLEILRNIDVRPMLANIRVPALVLHRRDDAAIRVQAGRFLAGRIPGARYVELDGSDHWWWVGDTRTILDEIEDFIGRLRPGSPG
jgi:DNA-binding SARP family transcriptional activator/pimeloyl-ACP methyl ester carboxylesterase